MYYRLILLSVTAVLLAATAFTSQASGPPAKCSKSASCKSDPNLAVSLVLAENEKLRLEVAGMTSRIGSVESAVTSSSKRADEVASRTSWISFGTALFVSLLAAATGFGVQFLLINHQRRINTAESRAKVANSYTEWQLKQLSELYGPLRALLRQSNILYRQMNKALVAADASRFQFVKGDDFDGQEFQIFLAGQWTRFRTVKHLQEIYNRGFGVEPYFDDVVNVGARMVNVIQEKAGFSRQGDIELVRVMGEYLAHYLVLARLLKKATEGESPQSNAADEQATFPNRIEVLVENGFNAINQEVMNWRDDRLATAESRTLEFYERNAASYAKRTANADLSELYERFLPLLPQGGRILDVGCGAGRDLRIFQQRGFDCLGVDPSPRLAKIAQGTSGCKTLVGKSEELSFDQCFDGVWACASLLHLRRTTLPIALARVRAALKSDGVLLMSMQEGEGETFDPDGRFFSRYSKSELVALVESAGFRVLDDWYSTDKMPERMAKSWINIVAQRV